MAPGCGTGRGASTSGQRRCGCEQGCSASSPGFSLPIWAPAWAAGARWVRLQVALVTVGKGKGASTSTIPSRWLRARDLGAGTVPQWQSLLVSPHLISWCQHQINSVEPGGGWTDHPVLCLCSLIPSIMALGNWFLVAPTSYFPDSLISCNCII